MSKFYVGQRVRIIGSINGHFEGMTATVVGPLEPSFDEITGEFVYSHDVDVDGIGRAVGGSLIARRPCDMEPLRDDLTTWESVRALTSYVPGEAVRS